MINKPSDDPPHDPSIAQLRREIENLRHQLAQTQRQLTTEHERADVLDRVIMERTKDVAPVMGDEYPVWTAPATRHQDASDDDIIELVIPVARPSLIEGTWERLRHWRRKQ